jgi:hypothetical protein
MGPMIRHSPATRGPRPALAERVLHRRAPFVVVPCPKPSLWPGPFGQVRTAPARRLSRSGDPGRVGQGEKDSCPCDVLGYRGEAADAPRRSSSCFAGGRRPWFASVKIIWGDAVDPGYRTGRPARRRLWRGVGSPPLAAAYVIGEPRCGRRAAADDIVITQPVPRSFMPGSTRLSVRNVAARLPSTDAPAFLAGLLKGPGLTGLPHAFATMMSIGPDSA